MTLRHSSAALLVVAVAALSGCKPSEPTVDSRVTDPQVLFETYCAKCHARAGEPGGTKYGGSRGPDLSHIGSASGMTAEWLADYVRDPKSRRPDAKLMPAFGDKLTHEQIHSLAAWLAAKK